MRRLFGIAAMSTLLVAALVGAVAARGVAPGVQISVLTAFPAGLNPAAVAATNTGDVVALAGPYVVSVGPNGQQKRLTTVSGGAFGTGIGIAYDRFHRLVVALPGSFGPPPQGTILSVNPNGKRVAPVPGSEGMVAPDGFGLDSATGDLYATDIFGNSLWRIGPDGSARLWTSVATNPLLVLPDGVKVFDGAVYVSSGAGTILRIPINPDGSAGTAQVWGADSRRVLRRPDARRPHRRRLRGATRHERAPADHPRRRGHSDRHERGRPARGGEHEPDPRRPEHGHLPREHRRGLPRHGRDPARSARPSSRSRSRARRTRRTAVGAAARWPPRAAARRRGSPAQRKRGT